MGKAKPLSSNVMEDSGALSSRASVTLVKDTTHPRSAPNVLLIHSQVRCIKKCSIYSKMIHWIDGANEHG